MSYQRKKKDTRKLRKLANSKWWPSGAYETTKPNTGKKYYKRSWKSRGKNSCWALHKKQSHRRLRRIAKSNKDVAINNKAYDIWWSVW